MAYQNEIITHTGFTTLVSIEAGDTKTAVGVAILAGLGWENEAATNKVMNMAENGYGTITNYRFIFGTDKAYKKLAAGQQFTLDESLVKAGIMLPDIISITQGKQGFSPLLVMETTAGFFKFAFMKKAVCDQWEAIMHQVTGR